MTAPANRRGTRRMEVLKELGLTPVWRVGAKPAPSSHVNRPSESRANDTCRTVNISAEPEEHEKKQAAGSAVPSDIRRSRIQHMDWAELQASVERCVACRLCESRTQAVFGVGDPDADWLYVGEGPGAREDATGEPFVGQAGKLLDNMLVAIDLKRGRNVFITNIVKCRPPGNREPQPDEAQCCEPYLARQIELIRPRLIIALGKTAAQNLLHTSASIGSLRGRLHQHAGIPVIVTYHPAYLLRTLSAKAKAWEDLCFARSTMGALETSR